MNSVSKSRVFERPIRKITKQPFVSEKKDDFVLMFERIIQNTDDVKIAEIAFKMKMSLEKQSSKPYFTHEPIDIYNQIQIENNGINIIAHLNTYTETPVLQGISRGSGLFEMTMTDNEGKIGVACGELKEQKIIFDEFYMIEDNERIKTSLSAFNFPIIFTGRYDF